MSADNAPTGGETGEPTDRISRVEALRIAEAYVPYSTSARGIRDLLAALPGAAPRGDDGLVGLDETRDEMLWYGKQLNHLKATISGETWRDIFARELAAFEAAVRADERAGSTPAALRARSAPRSGGKGDEGLRERIETTVAYYFDTRGTTGEGLSARVLSERIMGAVRAHHEEADSND